MMWVLAIPTIILVYGNTFWTRYGSCRSTGLCAESSIPCISCLSSPRRVLFLTLNKSSKLNIISWKDHCVNVLEGGKIAKGRKEGEQRNRQNMFVTWRNTNQNNLNHQPNLVARCHRISIIWTKCGQTFNMTTTLFFQFILIEHTA